MKRNLVIGFDFGYSNTTVLAIFNMEVVKGIETINLVSADEVNDVNNFRGLNGLNAEREIETPFYNKKKGGKKIRNIYFTHQIK